MRSLLAALRIPRPRWAPRLPAPYSPPSGFTLASSSSVASRACCTSVRIGEELLRCNARFLLLLLPWFFERHFLFSISYLFMLYHHHFLRLVVS
ncbi:hypothetical protein CFIMG_000301RA [Ceratocystis fimbriata CBS 114723]|uniref:Uncharacterized protein n=1 Tax=Ceratocystis fimbriata CBS 114723 TaxID=1035309 RepID=A0A2C5XI81_9PEZI|nr:hypothetical protein CFIMG_000301RA [Ceratocystis fimbriata CBS 114723]